MKTIFIISLSLTLLVFSAQSLRSQSENLLTNDDGIIFGNIIAKAKVAVSDSVNKTNYISKIWINNNTSLNYKVELDDPDYKIQIFIYNMLAKPVATVYEGITGVKTFENTYDVSNLPPGLYFLILTGPGFRHIEKFILTR